MLNDKAERDDFMRKIILLMLIICLVITCAGCSGQSDHSKDFITLSKTYHYDDGTENTETYYVNINNISYVRKNKYDGATVFMTDNSNHNVLSVDETAEEVMALIKKAK